MHQDKENKSCDVAVIGAGIAGASIGAELSAHCHVIVLEAESQPGYHTTGRSAALFAETYGPPPICALTRASRAFFENPPEGYGDHPLLSPRGVLMLASNGQMDTLDALLKEASVHGPVERFDRDGLLAKYPALKARDPLAGMLDKAAMDIDVNALHQGYLRQLKRQGGKVQPNAAVLAISRKGKEWEIETRAGIVSAATIVNAAGAWADEIGQMAGAMKIGLVPKRRTAVIVSAQPERDMQDYPLICDVDEDFYLKPESGKLLISPADETPSLPCDAQPEELDVAIAIDRIENAFDLTVKRVEQKWAGLRSFVADKCPVVGFDPEQAGFFWAAGQGGYGIQSAPAIARLAAAMVLAHAVPEDILDQGFELADISPQRLASQAGQ